MDQVSLSKLEAVKNIAEHTTQRIGQLEHMAIEKAQHMTKIYEDLLTEIEKYNHHYEVNAHIHANTDTEIKKINQKIQILREYIDIIGLKVQRIKPECLKPYVDKSMPSRTDRHSIDEFSKMSREMFLPGINEL